VRRWWVKLARYSPPPMRGLAAVALLILTATALETLRPWPLKLLVDLVLAPRAGLPQSRWLAAIVAGTSATTLIAYLALATVGIVCVAQLARLLQTYIQSGLGNRMAYVLGGKLFEQLQSMSLLFHQKRKTGDLMRRVLTDSACARDLFSAVAVPGAAALASLATMFLVMWRLDRALSLLAIAFAFPLIAVIRVFNRPISLRSAEQQQLEGQMMALAEQTLGAGSVVQSFTREPEQDARFRTLGAQTLRANLRSTAAQLWFKIAAGAVTAAGTATVMIVGGLHVLSGRLTIGSLLVFVSYLATLYSPLEALAYLSTSVATASASARRVLEILESGDRVIEQPHARDLTVRHNLSIRFENLVFGYEPGRSVLNEIDLQIAGGEIVALVGPTGAGKSTLAALVSRLFDPWSGAVLIGHEDLKNLTLSSVRKAVSVVPQEPFLLPLSVRDNIAYADPSADVARVKQAAQAAGADDFIQALPAGYDTILGERGCTLSAGQRQRLAIARALLKDAPILLLDEPTAALDAATERKIVDALQVLMRGRTCLVIAHRLSTIRHADRIVVLNRGRIVEQGTHQQLVQKDGLYQRMHALQFAPTSTPAEMVEA